jgi:hypothetical protein
MVRRLVAAVAGAALIASLSISSVSAAASPQGVLLASFNGYFAGGNGASYGTWVRGAQAWYHAAPTGIDLEAGAARIGAYGTAEEPQTHCASNLFGIWVIDYDNVLGKAGFAGQTWALSFGPADGPLTPLAIQQTPVKVAVDPQGLFLQFGGLPTWWESVGVPVYGRLAPGTYWFRMQDSFPAYDFSEDVTFVVVIQDC